MYVEGYIDVLEEPQYSSFSVSYDLGHVFVKNLGKKKSWILFSIKIYLLNGNLQYNWHSW